MLFENFTLIGDRYLIAQQNLILISTLFNVTMNYVEFRSHMQMADLATQLVYLDSSSLCPIAADNLVKTINITNLLVTEYSPIPKKQILIYMLFNMKSDAGKRTLIANLENITFQHMTTSQQNNYFNCNQKLLTIKNFTSNNVTQINPSIIQYFFSCSTQLQITNIRFINHNTTNRILGLFAITPTIVISNFQFQRNSFDPLTSSNCAFRFSSPLSTATVSLTNLTFRDNKMYGQQLIQQNSAIKLFQILNGTFINEGMYSNNHYLGIYQSQVVNLTNITFKGFKYLDEAQQNSFIIRMDQMQVYYSNLNSTFTNLSVTNVTTNFLSFGGFNSTAANTTTQEYRFTIQDLQVKHNNLAKDSNFITLLTSSHRANAVLRIVNASFFNNSIEGRKGNLVLASQSIRLGIRFINSSFSNNREGGISLLAGNVDTTAYYPTLVNIINCSIVNNTMIYSSFLKQLSVNTYLQVLNSNFTWNKGFSRGGILLQDFQLARALFNNSQFSNNFGLFGGIFLSQYEGVVEFNNCKFRHNYAGRGGIGVLFSDSYFIIRDSELQDNHAEQESLFGFSESQNQFSLLKNSRLSNNNQVTVNTIKENIDYQQSFQTENVFSVIAYSDELIKSSIKLRKSKMSIESCQIDGSRSFISAYQSKINFLNTSISNTKYQRNDSSFLLISSSYIQMSSISFSGISLGSNFIDFGKLQPRFLEANLRSTVIIKDSLISNMSLSIMSIFTSELIVTNLSIQNVTLRTQSQSLFEMDSSTLNCNYLRIFNVSSQASKLISLLRMKAVNFSAVQVQQIDTNFIISASSNIFMQDSTIDSKYQLSNQVRAIEIEGGSLMLQNVSIFNMKASTEGAAVYSHDSHFNSTNSIFTGNQADKGGAISFESNGMKQHQLILVNNTFDGNIALEQGGAICYSTLKPIEFSNNIFTDSNYAPYGSSIASYATDVRVIQIDNQKVASGQPFSGRIVVEVVDDYKQRVTLDQELMMVKVEAEDNNNSVLGKNYGVVQNGIAIIEGFSMVAKPGSTNQKFRVFSPAINAERIAGYYSLLGLNTNTSKLNNAVISVDFRFCISGEIVLNQQCVKCDEGSFSFGNDSLYCIDCPRNADCPGGDIISLDKGFWRSSYYSQNVISCIYPESCLGGALSSDSSNINEICKNGYGGNLCQVCQDQYTKINLFECGQCPSFLGNLFKILGLFLIMLIILAIMIYINLRHSNDSETSVVLRIMVSYVQIVSSSSSFNLKWPTYMKQLMGTLSTIGQVPQSFVSLDCLLRDLGSQNSEIPPVFIKVAFLAISPIVMISLISLFFIVRNLIVKQQMRVFKRQVVVSFVIIIYSLHPTIVKYTTDLLFCIEIDRDEFWLYQDLSIQCWTGIHKKFSIIFAVPIFITWIFGIPIAFLAFLIVKKEKIYKKIYFEKFRMIYQGVKQKFFYWDFVNLLLKTILTCINVVLALYSDFFQALIVLMIFSIYLKIQKQVQPYNNPTLNLLEYNQNLAVLFTFFLSLLFFQEYVQAGVQMIAFVAIVGFHLRFYALWLYCLARSYRNRVTNFVASVLRKLILDRQSLIADIAYDQQRKKPIHMLKEKRDRKLDPSSFSRTQLVPEETAIGVSVAAFGNDVSRFSVLDQPSSQYTAYKQSLMSQILTTHNNAEQNFIKARGKSYQRIQESKFNNNEAKDYINSHSGFQEKKEVHRNRKGRKPNDKVSSNTNLENTFPETKLNYSKFRNQSVKYPSIQNSRRQVDARSSQVDSNLDHVFSSVFEKEKRLPLEKVDFIYLDNPSRFDEGKDIGSSKTGKLFKKLKRKVKNTKAFKDEPS